MYIVCIHNYNIIEIEFETFETETSRRAHRYRLGAYTACAHGELYRVYREDNPISRREGLAAWTKKGFFPFYLLTKEKIKTMRLVKIKC